ncbi:hypothetical protein JL722_14073 [Aureococcus anophagefferens]|nr:hypothetical protein JL722_14073 [Aureococcus anophagefferens]
MGTARRTECRGGARSSGGRASGLGGSATATAAARGRAGLLALLRRPTWAARHLTLALGANLFTGKGVARLLKRLDAACVDVAPTLRHLRVLDLSFCRFRALDATLLAEAVVGADELRVATLKLSGRAFGGERRGARLALSGPRRAQEPRARRRGRRRVAGLHHDCALRHLDVAANGFGLAGTRRVAVPRGAPRRLHVAGPRQQRRGQPRRGAARRGLRDPMGLERPCFAYLRAQRRADRRRRRGTCSSASWSGP